jgi:hypothetical protein
MDSMGAVSEQIGTQETADQVHNLISRYITRPSHQYPQVKHPAGTA